jgi:hypothetical protein
VVGFCEHGDEPSGSIKTVISSLLEGVLASQERLFSMELIDVWILCEVVRFVVKFLFLWKYNHVTR